GYDRDFAQRCYQQIEGFGSYGFPESHAASFALLVYISAWIKGHYPEVFAAALLNSQPMGFYAPAQIVRDAREHGVTVLPVDANPSHWASTLELPSPPQNPSPQRGEGGTPRSGEGEGELPPARCLSGDHLDGIDTPSPNPLPKGRGHDESEGRGLRRALRLGF